MRIYIPFNMIIDIDSGIIRLLEKVQNIESYPVNKLKSFLLKRNNENPIPEYCKIRGIDGISEYSYDIILDKHYDKLLPLSLKTDMIAFIINTCKLGLLNELRIMIGCDYKSEIEYLSTILSSFNVNTDIGFNIHIDLKEYDYIFTKYIDDYSVDYFLNTVGIEGKRLYIADYRFNTLYDNEQGMAIINPEILMDLESKGNVVSLVSIYNKKQNGGNK